MNILFCKHNSICEPGIIRALELLGHKLILPSCSFSHPDTDDAYDAVLCEEIRKNSFDLVFSVNFIPVIATVCYRLQVPYFCWIVDSPVIQLYSHTLQYDSNYVFLFDYTLYTEFCRKNPGHIFICRSAATFRIMILLYRLRRITQIMTVMFPLSVLFIQKSRLITLSARSFLLIYRDISTASCMRSSSSTDTTFCVTSYHRISWIRWIS